jgi:hypothetical protein
MWGLSGVLSILGAVATRKQLHHLQLSEQPNMPFLYWLAVLGAIFKPKWTSSKAWPALKVRAALPEAPRWHAEGRPACPRARRRRAGARL